MPTPSQATQQSGKNCRSMASNGRREQRDGRCGEGNDDAGGVRLNLSQNAVQEFQINR